MTKETDIETLEAKERQLRVLQNDLIDEVKRARKRKGETWYVLNEANKAVKSAEELVNSSRSSYEQTLEKNSPQIESTSKDLIIVLDKIKLESENELKSREAGRHYAADVYFREVRRLGQSAADLTEGINTLRLEIEKSERLHKSRKYAHAQAMKNWRKALSNYRSAKEEFDEVEKRLIEGHEVYQPARAAYEEELKKLKDRAGIQNQNVRR